MSTNPHGGSRAGSHSNSHTSLQYGSGSVISSRTVFTPTGSPRPSRPGQLDPGIIEGIAGGSDPEAVNQMSHTSAAALLDRVRHSEDSAIVSRVLTLVDREGVDVIAELWSRCEPDSLPGILWRLYLLRSWMRSHGDDIARLWRIGEPVATAASAIAGVDQYPDAADIARTADSILAGAFTGDFAIALERAATFVDVIALGLRVEARHHARRAQERASQEQTSKHPTPGRTSQERVARLLHTAGNLFATAKDFRYGADLWRRGRLE